MKKPSTLTSLLIALIALILVVPTTMAAPQGPPRIVEIENHSSLLVFYPIVNFGEMVLTVTGPCGFEYREVSDGGEMVFKLGEETIDGMYRFNVRRVEKIDSGIISQLKKARKNLDEETPKKLCRQGLMPAAPISQSAGFLVAGSKIVWDEFSVDEATTTDISKRFDDPSVLANASSEGAGGVPTKDFVILDDLIVDGSACIGFDCVNGESFGFDTLRLKENNLRIKFDDTSVAASFPRNDWQLTANDSANGGASKFSIDDISGGRTPFTVEANARSHSLYVDDGGRIGNRTSTPSTEIHTIDGDTPTLRLQQDGSSGFAPQTWDVAGNETNFFIRDVTNGSTLPFRIRPGAPTSSIFVDVDGDVGMGTSSPSANLELSAGAPVAIELTNTASSGDPWRFNAPSNGAFRVSDSDSGTAVTEFELDGPGNLTIAGMLTVCDDTSVCNPTQTFPDYVFEPDYSLMPLAELKAFIEENKHLPNVPSVDDVAENGLNMTELQMRLLEKVEELTLYTLSLQETIQAQQTVLDQLTNEASE